MLQPNPIPTHFSFHPQNPSQSVKQVSLFPSLPPSFLLPSLLPFLTSSLSLSLCCKQVTSFSQNPQNPKAEEQKKHTHTHTPKSPRTKSPKAGDFFVVVFPTFLFLHTHTQTNKQTELLKTQQSCGRLSNTLVEKA
jgi:hypothetical protein